MKVLVTSYPFAEKNSKPLEILKEKGYEIICEVNELKRKLTFEEIEKQIIEVDAIIAGTEKYDNSILSKAKNLKIISRLGIGLDSIDFVETNKRNIAVAYTPDAPSLAVAELTLGFILSLSRRIYEADKAIRNQNWKRIIGLDVSQKKIGIIGLGRIGKIMVKLLKPFNCEIFVNDIEPDKEFILKHKLKFMEKTDMYRNADIISLHIPKTNLTSNMIAKNELLKMKENVILINTARGGIINEKDLYTHLKINKEFYAAIDVYEKEPYYGDFCELNNVILTAHMGSCSEQSRFLMELGASQNIIDFFENGSCKNLAKG
jgi:D-3-phosphoglycerate dehydrogenase